MPVTETEIALRGRYCTSHGDAIALSGKPSGDTTANPDHKVKINGTKVMVAHDTYGRHGQRQPHDADVGVGIGHKVRIRTRGSSNRRKAALVDDPLVTPCLSTAQNNLPSGQAAAPHNVTIRTR